MDKRLKQVLLNPYEAKEEDIELLQLWSEKYPAVSMFKIALSILINKYQNYWSSNMNTLTAADVAHRAHFYHMLFASDHDHQSRAGLQEDLSKIIDLELNKDIQAHANHAAVMKNVGVYDINSLLDEGEGPVDQNNIIDTFIKNEPSISKPKVKVFKVADKAKESLEEHDDLVTETLAQIYVKQGHYKKAKEIYQKLILKNPEKNTYFAGIIKNLEKNL